MTMLQLACDARERITSAGAGMRSAAIRTIAALCLVLVTLASAGAQTVGISSGSANGVDSLRFDWPARVGYEAQKFGNTLAIVFNRPVAADFGPVANGVGDFISDVSLDSDNRTVLIDLTGNPRFRSSRAGTSVVLEFFDRNAPTPATAAAPAQAGRAAVAPASPARAPATAPAAAPAQNPPPPASPRPPNVPELSVRTGTHEKFYRFVFDWTKQTPYSVSEQPDRAIIRFENPAWINDEEVRRFIPERLKNFSSVPGGNAIEVTIPLQAREGIRHFTNGTRVVLDVVEGGEPSRTGLSASASASTEPAVPTPRAAPVEPVTAAVPENQATDSAKQVAAQFGLQPQAGGAPGVAVPPASLAPAPGNAPQTEATENPAPTPPAVGAGAVRDGLAAWSG